LAGLGRNKQGAQGVFGVYFGLTAGTMLNWLAGMVQFSIITGRPMQDAFMLAVFPFLPTGILRIAIVPPLGKSLRAALAKISVNQEQ
jgi:biotin transporter BioY